MKSQKRLEKELAAIESHIFTEEPPYYVVRHTAAASKPQPEVGVWRVFILGPAGTPYQGGFFVFSFDFKSSNYPFEPPKVAILTTDDGKVRFNPNLYAGGKVCLSTLGTYGNDWSAALSTVNLVDSIRGLVMTADPYYNEPGFEKDSARGKSAATAEVGAYTRKITHEVLRVAVISAMEGVLKQPSSVAAAPACAGAATAGKRGAPPAAETASQYFAPFTMNMISLFRVWYVTHRKTCLAEQAQVADGKAFVVAPFEFPGNESRGVFKYRELIQRLDAIAGTLEERDEQKRRTGSDGKPLPSGAAPVHCELKDGVLECAMAAGERGLQHWFALGVDGSKLPACYGTAPHAVEILYAPRGAGDISAQQSRPVVRLLGPRKMFHPHVSEDGFVYFFMRENAVQPPHEKFALERVAKMVEDVLTQPPEHSQASWANAEAGKLFFSSKASETDAFKERATAWCTDGAAPIGSKKRPRE